MTSSRSSRSLCCPKHEEPRCLHVTCRSVSVQWWPYVIGDVSNEQRACHAVHYFNRLLPFTWSTFTQSLFVVQRSVQGQIRQDSQELLVHFLVVSVVTVRLPPHFWGSYSLYSLCLPQQTSTGEETLRMCVAVKKKLQLYYWKDRDFHELQVCESTRCHVCCGFFPVLLTNLSVLCVLFVC